MLAESINRAPEDMQARLAFAATLLAVGENDLAERELSSVIEAGGEGVAGAWVMLGEISQGKGDSVCKFIVTTRGQEERP